MLKPQTPTLNGKNKDFQTVFCVNADFYVIVCHDLPRWTQNYTHMILAEKLRSLSNQTNDLLQTPSSLVSM